MRIFDNIYYGLLMNRALSVSPFTSTEYPRQLKMEFAHLAMLYNMERGLPVKLTYKLIEKVLKP